MLVSEDLLDRAKKRAENILKTSIVNLAIMLDVDLDTLDGNYFIPVPENDIYYKNHLSLKRMCQNLESLQSL